MCLILIIKMSELFLSFYYLYFHVTGRSSTSFRAFFVEWIKISVIHVRPIFTSKLMFCVNDRRSALKFLRLFQINAENE